MSEKHLFHVRKRTLLAIAGCVWLLAGVMFWVMFAGYPRTDNKANETAAEV